MIAKAVLQECRAMLKKGKDVEDILRWLRRGGYSAIDSMLVISEVQGVSLAEAKVIVHFSTTWNDTREDTEELHKEFLEALKEYEIDDDAKD